MTKKQKQWAEKIASITFGTGSTVKDVYHGHEAIQKAEALGLPVPALSKEESELATLIQLNKKHDQSSEQTVIE